MIEKETKQLERERDYLAMQLEEYYQKILSNKALITQGDSNMNICWSAGKAEGEKLIQNVEQIENRVHHSLQMHNM